MDLPIVVGVDGSEPSLRAVDWAVDEAASRGAPLRLVYASLWERYEGADLADDLGRPSGQVAAEDIVAVAARRAHRRRADVRVSTHTRPEEPEYALVRESRDASLLVTGTRGRSGIAEALLGSVSLTVAGHAHCPMVVVRGDHDNQVRPGTHGRIVVGVAEKPVPSAAVTFAADEARRHGAALEAVRAWRCPAYETTDLPMDLAAEPARAHEQRAMEVLEKALHDVPAEVATHRRAVEGRTRNVLVDASSGADLLVVGVRRRHGHLGLQLGRVAHGVLHHSACPVALVPEWT